MPPIRQAFDLDIGDEQQTQQLAFGGISANAMKKIIDSIGRDAVYLGFGCKLCRLDEVYAFATKFEHKALAVRCELC